MKRLLCLMISVGFIISLQADYTIANRTNYPAKLSLTLICKWDDGHYSERTIDLDFKPKESKNIPPTCRMKSMSAILYVDGAPYSTGVFSGGIYSGKSSGLLPSWEISDSVEGQYSSFKPFIRMSP